MKYLALICVDKSFAPSAEEGASIARETDAWVTEMDGRGIRLQGSVLGPLEEARVIRVRDANVLISDGPFAETKEFIAGFDLFECSDLDEAIEVASKHPMAKHGALEIRPLWAG